ncbi:Putative uncharacterized protein [Taphrina deformans PYCC 5710]|uniref:Aminopeptidase P N-terminal domain-containing protein n=1 Tax=Taphrina deformans (strain PYCC 5710 / ATCC 11124 / CBS 356.35 / IMI 108563 / JCM 9778 / NBRC 8474) TaxID=1097556 RepID=R4XAU5_TAPDE|nr:Putative uncharacterized protein [Taphrina deformans PYCC 5710]|eukprot:CCG82664.1 Putative uncharacterized protein [Taphrina deformans PYCC 5710]
MTILIKISHAGNIGLGDSLVFVIGSSTRFMRGVAFYEFRQNANMFYLTGISEPDAAMILKTDNSTKGYTMHLFMQPKDDFDETWYGYRSGLSAARQLFGADEVDDFSNFVRVAKDMIGSAQHVYLDKNEHGDLAGSCHGELLQAIGSRKCIPLSALVHKLRIIKSDAELALLRRVGQISGRVYNDAMRRSWTNEADLQAELRHGWIKHGAEREAYVPVVAGGDRASCIHYTQNNRLIGEGEMIFVDAGAELGGYLTDISRAWPASGKFSEPQRDLYQAVLNVEKACVKMCTQDSAHSIQTIHMESIELMKIELRNLGFKLVEGDVERYLYPHRVGHHIGLEIHDCSSLGGFESLRENQTITIEPGCYVPYDDQWPKHFQGLALRVEDSIAIGKEVPTILSVEAVKEIVDIEALRA